MSEQGPSGDEPNRVPPELSDAEGIGGVMGKMAAAYLASGEDLNHPYTSDAFTNKSIQNTRKDPPGDLQAPDHPDQ